MNRIIILILICVVVMLTLRVVTLSERVEDLAGVLQGLEREVTPQE